MLCAMHRDGIRSLTGAEDVTLAVFSRAFPDSKAWFGVLAKRGGQGSLQCFFDHLEYRGRPEFFSMFACLVGNSALHVNPEWLLQQCSPLRQAMKACAVQNGFMGVPAKCVREVLAEYRGTS